MEQTLLKNTIDLLSQIVEKLYQENIQSGYMLMTAALPQLERVISMVEDSEKQDVLKEKLMMALGAMEDQDSTLLADIFQYEIIEELNGFIEE